MFSQSSGNSWVGFIRLAITRRWLVYSSFQKQFVRLKFLLANPIKVQAAVYILASFFTTVP